MTIKTLEFNRELLQLLKDSGYTHIYNMGIRINIWEADSEDYVLVPLKPDDARLQYEETEMMIEDINSSDVYDMADGDPFITFLLDMPEHEYEQMINK